MGKGLIILSLALLLAGCDQWKQVYGNFCDVAEPLSFSAAAIRAMTPSQRARFTAHNEYGEQKCGWKP